MKTKILFFVLFLTFVTLLFERVAQDKPHNVEKIDPPISQEIKKHPCEESPYKDECYAFERELGRL